MQQRRAEVLVKFQNGDVVTYVVSDHEEFHALVEKLSKPWGAWIYIGKNAAVRKSTVNQVYYYPEGYISA